MYGNHVDVGAVGGDYLTNNKPMFPVARLFLQKMREKKVREKAVDRLGDAAMAGVGDSVGQEAGRRVSRRFRPGPP